MVSHVEAEAGNAWQYMQNQLDFIVPSTSYTLDILSPQPGQTLYAGQDVTIEVAIKDGAGNPVSGATVTATSPTGSPIPLTEIPAMTATGTASAALASLGTGIYAGTYTILPTDPVGDWVIAVVASVGGEFPKQSILTTVVPNLPPVAEANGPYTVNEGSCVIITGSGTDPQGLPLTYAWDLNGDGVFEIPGQSVPFCGVDGPKTAPVALQVCDSAGLCGNDTSTVTINNVPPTVGAISASVNPVPVNTAINATANFTDPGVLDTHTAVWNWGDGASSPGVMTETNGSGSVAGSHTYTAAGIYTITLTVTDKDGGQGHSVNESMVVYDPNGVVTGNGWIKSPAGTYKANPQLTGMSSFGFVANYNRGATVPTGATEFHLPAGNLNFYATSYQWLVVTGARAQCKGTGSINGTGNYGFMLTVIDGQVKGGGGLDKFRIKIMLGSNVIYDNQMGAPDSANPTTTVAGFNIVVRQ